MIPAVLGSLGTASAGAAIAPALQVLTIPFLILTAVTLSRGWYLDIKAGGHWRGLWAIRSRRILIATTIASVTLWILRFGGALGPKPF